MLSNTIRVTLLLSTLISGIDATATAGLTTCLCIESLPDSSPKYDCTFDWNSNGKCVSPTGLPASSNFSHYPAAYGTSCKVQEEPGHPSCWDLSSTPPVPKSISEQADWCQRKWCYVDPCACDAPDQTKSDYFPDVLFYSYATCGDKNTYTAVESADNTVGNANSACPSGDTSTSDAKSLKVGLGLLLAGMVAIFQLGA